jgi:protein tyrosine phosphatase domain-containing protein 1
MKEYDLIKVFLNQNIKAIFNLQIPGEHASCADGLDPSSAFSYVPESFMDNGISFYNFGWTDMEVPDMETVLGLVNVMAFSHQKGEKVNDTDTSLQYIVMLD